MLLVDWSTNIHAVANGGHGFSRKLENLNPVNRWRPCITFRNFSSSDLYFSILEIKEGKEKTKIPEIEQNNRYR